MKLSRQLTGIAGEYYVAAELSRRNYLAAITLRNSDGTDILVSNLEGDKLISIQVKTTQNKLKWILNKKIENEKSDKKFFVFVNIPAETDKKPEYFIISAQNLSQHIYDGHRNWLNKPGKNEKVRQDSDVRQFDPKYFVNNELLTWEGLIESINQK